MTPTAYEERWMRGTLDFPIEFHYIDQTHPRYQMPFHWHVEYELIRVLKGSLQLSLDEENFTIHVGDAALIPDGAVHGGSAADCVYECIVFDFMRLTQELAVCGRELDGIADHSLRLRHFFEKGSSVSKIADELFQALEQRFDGYEFFTVGLLWQMAGTLLRDRLYEAADHETTASDKRVRQLKNALRRIRRDYAQPLTLSELAAEAGLSPKYFCRFFEQVTGRTPINYLNFYRIEHAGELLLTSDGSVTDIAFSCGFNDLSYFVKTFKKYKGVSPGVFRKNAKMSRL